MRILFVLHERNLGGASRSAVTLMTELKERGHEVYAVLPIRQGQVYPKLKELGIPTRVVFFGWQSMPAYWNGFLKAGFRFLYATEDFAVRRIMWIIRRDRIQIVHSNSSVIDAGARAACLCGVPHVWHIRVTVEAMLASNPVIGSDTGATPELIEDGKTGYLFRAGDDKSLADCMKRLIEDPKRIAIMGKAAQETAKMRFLSKRNTDQIEQLYHDLLTESTGR